MELLLDSPVLTIVYHSPYTGNLITMSPTTIDSYRTRSWDMIGEEFYVQYGVFDFIIEGGRNLYVFLNTIRKPNDN